MCGHCGCQVDRDRWRINSDKEIIANLRIEVRILKKLGMKINSESLAFQICSKKSKAQNKVMRAALEEIAWPEEVEKFYSDPRSIAQKALEATE